MKTAIITGASKGLGASIAKLLMEKGIHIVGISRTENTKLKHKAKEYDVSYEHCICDLSDLPQVEHIFTELAKKYLVDNNSQVILINNAAMIDPINKAGHYDISELVKHIETNLTAPMISTNLFVQQAEKQNSTLIAVNVTSGAANRSVSGWSAYCSAKAGLNRFSETVALEQGELETNTKVILFDPSIMDTDMQGQIRSSSEDAFKDVSAFQQYKQDNSLRDTDVVAATLVDILMDHTNIINGKNYSVKELL